MSHYIYFKRDGGLPVVVQDVETGEKKRVEAVHIMGPSKIIHDEANPDVDVSVYCITDNDTEIFFPA